MSNNYAFIDSQNLNLSIRDQGWQLDYKRFYFYLRHKYKVTKAFIFIGYITSQQTLYTVLRQHGYILIFKPTINFKNGQIKGNVDAELVLHTMIEWNNYDKAVIVTGDGDFYCLIEYLRNQSKLEKIVIPNRYKYSTLLIKFGKDMIFMNELKDKLEYFR